QAIRVGPAREVGAVQAGRGAGRRPAGEGRHAREPRDQGCRGRPQNVHLNSAAEAASAATPTPNTTPPAITLACPESTTWRAAGSVIGSTWAGSPNPGVSVTVLKSRRPRK